MWLIEPQTGQPLIIGVLTYGPDSYCSYYDDACTGGFLYTTKTCRACLF